MRYTVGHSDAGLRGLLSLLTKHGVGEVAIERPDGPVIDALLDGGLTVVVISPNQVKNLRGRYGSAGNKDDRFDAFVLADTLRTDRARLRPLTPDSPATVTLRQACRARKDLVAHRVGLANQLREHLRRVFPGAVGLFADIDSQISLTFLGRFSAKTVQTGSRRNAWPPGWPASGCCGRTDPAVLHARLTAAPRGLVGERGAAESHITRAFLAVAAEPDRTDQSIVGPDRRTAGPARRRAHLHQPAPRGRVRAARLLGEIGDCRARFPHPESLACLAGVAPSTRQSGKIRSVGFRWSCDKQLRDAVTDFAGDSRRANPWAADLYDRALAPAATTIPTRCESWPAPGSTSSGTAGEDNTAYDPAKHRALQHLIQTRNQTAA